MLRKPSQFTLAIALLAVSGCNSILQPVEGQLVWEDGQPANELEGSMVYFLSGEHRTTSRGLVRAGGKFELTTNRPESQGADGVPPGLHQIYVVASAIPVSLDARFADPSTSGLEIILPSDEPIKLELSRSKAEDPEQADQTRSVPEAIPSQEAQRDLLSPVFESIADCNIVDQSN